MRQCEFDEGLDTPQHAIAGEQHECAPARTPNDFDDLSSCGLDKGRRSW